MRYECTGNSLSRTHRLKLLDDVCTLRESNLLNMTYKVGDNVKYHATEHTEKTCECCGSVDDVYKEVVRTGTIESAGLATLFSVANGFVHDETEVQPDGTLLHRPSLAPVDIRDGRVLVYKINGEMMTEESIIGLTN